MASLSLLVLCLFSFLFVNQGFLIVSTSDFPNFMYFINLITYQFGHANKAHILGNILLGFPWLFYLEFKLKEKASKVFDVFIWGGVAGGLLQNYISHGALIGASASLSAVAGYAAFKQGKLTELRVFLLLVVLANIMANWIAAFAGADGVGHWGHLGGYFYGIGAALWPSVRASLLPHSSGSRTPQSCDQPAHQTASLPDSKP